MGDKIAIMYGGLLQQVGTPTEVYDKPRNLFVAGFIGSPSMNFLPCRRDGSGLRLAGEAGAPDTRLDIDPSGQLGTAPTDADLVLGVRPEDVHLSAEAVAGSLPAPVYLVELLGSENIVNVQIGGHVVKARTGPTFRPAVGDQLHARFDPSRAHLFDAASTLRLGA